MLDYSATLSDIFAGLVVLGFLLVTFVAVGTNSVAISSVILAGLLFRGALTAFLDYFVVDWSGTYSGAGTGSDSIFIPIIFTDVIN